MSDEQEKDVIQDDEGDEDVDAHLKAIGQKPSGETDDGDVEAHMKAIGQKPSGDTDDFKSVGKSPTDGDDFKSVG